MSDQNNANREPTITKFAKGDIYDDYDPKENEEKFDYLKAKYIFRFPFTFTSIKWGLALGSIFALHTYIKTRNMSNTFFWFVWGSILTGMPIWGFFMFKYSFYTMTLRKFEVDSFQQVEDSNLLRNYMMKKIGINDVSINDQVLLKKIEAVQKQHLEKYGQLDDLLSDLDEKEFEINSNNTSNSH